MSVPARKIAERLGGRAVFDGPIGSDMELVERVKQGFPTDAIEALLRAGALTPAEVHRLVIPRRTLAHRKARRQRLSPEESDRLARVARILAHADEVFANEAKAAGWLRDTSPALGQRSPLDLLDTEGGARLVEQELTRIAHGVFA